MAFLEWTESNHRVIREVFRKNGLPVKLIGASIGADNKPIGVLHVAFKISPKHLATVTVYNDGSHYYEAEKKHDQVGAAVRELFRMFRREEFSRENSSSDERTRAPQYRELDTSDRDRDNNDANLGSIPPDLEFHEHREQLRSLELKLSQRREDLVAVTQALEEQHERYEQVLNTLTQERDHLQQKIEQHTALLESLAEQTNDARSRLENDETKLADLQTRTREVLDHFRVEIQDLLSDLLQIPGLDSLPQRGRPAKADAAPVTGGVLAAPDRFVKDRLLPNIVRYCRPASLLEAQVFHAAVLVVPWVVLPDLTFARAYQKALGCARLHVIDVSPTWLSFSDAWNNGLGEAWSAGVQADDHLTLICLDHLNRSLAVGWTRPLCNLRRGLVPELPGGFPWPSHVRLLSTMAEDEGVLPLHEAVLGCMAALPKDPLVGKGNVEAEILEAPGHVPLENWLKWREEHMKSKRALDEGYVPSVALELAALESVLGPLSGMDGRAERLATLVRVTWPAAFRDSH